MKTKKLIALTMLLSTIGVQAQETPNEKKMLVVYYSHSGNTREMAKQIQTLTGADIFEIQPVKAYPQAYNTLTDQAKKEINSGYKPELKSKVENFERYDVIFVGSPCWWSTYAPPVATFLSSYNFDNKTIVPFMTHGGSGMGHAEADIRKLCPKATLLQALPISGERAKNSAGEVEKWLRKIGLKK